MIKFESLENTAKNTAKIREKENKIEANIDNVLKYLKEYPNIKQKNILNDLHLSKRTLERIIAFLKKKNYIERIGNNRSGYWKILKEL